MCSSVSCDHEAARLRSAICIQDRQRHGASGGPVVASKLAKAHAALLGHGEEVVLCRYSNYCEGLDQKHKQVTCELWDRAALDAPDAVLASDGKRRLIAPKWFPGGT